MATEANPTTGEISNTTDLAYLSKLSGVDLENMARSLYGLNVSNGTPKKDLIDAIQNAAMKFRGNHDMRIVDEGGPKGDVPKGFVKIRVTAGPHNPKARPIIIGLNFKIASIPCNKDIIMPGRWLVCLQDAVEGRAVLGVNEEGREELQFVEGHKYPFTILVDNR